MTKRAVAIRKNGADLKTASVFFPINKYYKKKIHLKIAFNKILTRDGKSRVVGIGTVLFSWKIIDVETESFRLASCDHKYSFNSNNY